jgi:hypothetical protein
MNEKRAKQKYFSIIDKQFLVFSEISLISRFFEKQLLNITDNTVYSL